MTDCDWGLLAKFAQDEDHAAFATLVHRHRPLLEATCRRKLGNGSDADDAVQAALFQLARSAEQLTRDATSQRSLPAWLNRVATNICRDVARSRAARRRREQEYVRRSAAAAGPMTTERMLPIVDELIAGLPDQLREPIVLCYLQGRGHAQAAEELGITEGTLRRRIQSAKSMLRSRFATRGIPVSMFLLHMLMDSLGAGVESDPLSGVEGPPAETLRPFRGPQPGSITRPVMSGAASWAIKAGLLMLVIGMIPVLHHFLSDEQAAQASPDVAVRTAALAVREPAAPVVADVAAPVISSRTFDQQPIETPEPRMAEIRPSAEIDTPPEPEPNLEPALVDEPTTELTTQTEPQAIVSVTPKSATPAREVDELFGIEWHTTLESACAEARGEPDKPILCFRVLGRLSGFM